MLLSQPSVQTRAVEVSQKTRGPRALSPLQCEYPFAGRTPSAPGNSQEVDARSPNKHRARRQPTCVARAHSITLSVKESPGSVLSTAYTSNTLPCPRLFLPSMPSISRERRSQRHYQVASAFPPLKQVPHIECSSTKRYRFGQVSQIR